MLLSTRRHPWQRLDQHETPTMPRLGTPSPQSLKIHFCRCGDVNDTQPVFPWSGDSSYGGGVPCGYECDVKTKAFKKALLCILMD